MSKYTPGPWANDATVPLKAINCERLGYSIAWVNGHREKEAEANARLIAKAPEMVELLRVVANADYGINVMMQARALLAEIEQ